MLTEDIINEEAKADLINSAKIEDELVSHAKKANEELDQNQRFLRLENLLTKSKFYCDFLLTKLDGKRDTFKAPLKDNTDYNNNKPKSKRLKIGKKEKTKLSDAETFVHPKYFTGGLLKPYQIEGLEWLKILYENGINGILADEMGLGKTVQCIAFIAFLIEKGVPGPYIIVAPLSTIPNWMSEFARFAPKITTILFHGNLKQRKALLPLFKITNPVTKSLPVIVTSYDMAMSESYHLKHIYWRYLIIDEGHRIKNFKCKLFSVLKSFKSANRLLLTGTPLQNNLSELWALLNFLVPEIFDDLTVFVSWFDVSELCTTLNNSDVNQDDLIKEREEKVVNMLHQILAPFLLRRLKSAVELNIPPKKELVVYTPLSPCFQSTCYKAILAKNLDSVVRDMRQSSSLNPIENKELNGRETVSNCVTTKDDEKGRKRKAAQKVDFAMIANIEKSGNEEGYEKMVENYRKYLGETVENNGLTSVGNNNGARIPQVTRDNQFMLLRKCCSHPYLLDLDHSYPIDQTMINCSGKLLILDQLVSRLIADGHKILLFSQMTSVLDVIEDYCTYKDFAYLRLDGSTPLGDRREDVAQFQNTQSDISIYLISTRAGGLGINLSAADCVIIIDSDWNPQSDLQAQDRCHRIGQTNPVVVYRFVTEGTIDQYMVNRAYTKRKLEKMIIPKEKFKDSRRNLTYFKDNVPLSKEDIIEMLTSKEYDSVYNNPSKDSKGPISLEDIKLSKEELDALVNWGELFQDYYHNHPKAKATKANGKKSKIIKDITKFNKFEILETQPNLNAIL